MSNKSYWTQVIRSRSGWLDLDIRALWRYRDLILLFVKRDLSSVYKQTILGPLWHFLQPLMSSFIFAFAFAFIARIPTGEVPPILFYLSGIVPWTYFADCTNRTAGTFGANAAIFGKVYFPRLIAPLSTILSSLVKFLIQFSMLGIFLVGFLVLDGSSVIKPNAAVLLVPFLLMIMALFGLGAGLLVTSLTTRYKDLANLVAFGVQLLMYVSPVIFPTSLWEDIAAEHPFVRWIIYANPMSSVITTFRFGFLGVGNIELLHLVYSAGMACVVLLAGLIMFNRTEKRFIDTI